MISVLKYIHQLLVLSNTSATKKIPTHSSLVILEIRCSITLIKINLIVLRDQSIFCAN